MAIYCFVFIYPIIIRLLLGKLNNKKNKKIFLFSVFLVLILLSGFRSPQVGTDTNEYYHIYECIRDNGFFGYIRQDGSSIEIGFSFLIWLFSRIFYTPYIFIFSISFFILYSFAVAIYRFSSDVFLSTIIFIAWMFPSTLNGIRQYFAFSFVLFAIYAIDNKKILKSFLLFFSALLIHKSSIILISVYFVYLFKNKNKHFLTLLILSFIILSIALLSNYFLPLLTIISYRYGQYLFSNTYLPTKTISLMFFICLIIFILFLYIINQTKYKKENTTSNNKTNLIFAILLLIQILCEILTCINTSIFNRFILFTKFSLVILIPFEAKCFSKKHSKILANAIQIIICLFFIIWGLEMYSQNPDNILPYTTFFFK